MANNIKSQIKHYRDMPEADRLRINVHAYSTNQPLTSRIDRITGTLAESDAFDKVIIIGIWEPGLLECEVVDDRREVWRIRNRFAGQNPRSQLGKVFHRLEWIIRTFFLLIKMPATCLNAHVLIILPPFVFLKWTTGCKLVYDTHELETEKNSLHWLIKPFAKVVEFIFIRFADSVSTVSDSIAAWYRKTHPASDVHVVRNITRTRRRQLNPELGFRQKFAINDDEFIYLYVGGFMAGRGIDILIEAFSRLPSDCHLVFLGFGPLEETIKAAQSDRIHYHPAVASAEVCSLAAGADVGLVPLKSSCLNHFFCLPNKLFECLHAGLPVIASAFPDLSGIVNHWQCGWTFEPNADDLERLIRSLDKKEISEKKCNALKAGSQLVWENEEASLLDIYKSIGLLHPKDSEAIRIN